MKNTSNTTSKIIPFGMEVDGQIIIRVRDPRGRIQHFFVAGEYDRRGCPVCNTPVVIASGLDGEPIYLNAQTDEHDVHTIHTCSPNWQKRQTGIEAACRDVLEIYERYRECFNRLVRLRSGDARRELTFAELRMLADQLAGAVRFLLRQDGAVTPHGLISARVAPVLNLILPPGALPEDLFGRGKNRWWTGAVI